MIKNTLSLLLVVGFATVGYAQTSYGIKAGLNFPSLKTSLDNFSASTGASTNFYLTGYADLILAKSWSFQPGISLQGKGGKSNVYFSDGNSSSAGSISLMYLDIPLNFVYYIPAGSGNIFLGAGPYLGLGLSAKVKANSISESGSFSDIGLKTVDAGFNFMAGYKLSNGFLINAGYGLGLANMLKDSGDLSMKNRVWSVGVGYQF